MQNAIFQGLCFFVLGAMLMLGIRAVEWVVPKPKQAVVFCIVEKNGKAHGCRPMAEYLMEVK